MEASVRLYHGDEGMRGDALLEADIALGNGDDAAGLPAAHKIIAQIRRLARRNFPNEPMDAYYYSAAAFHFRLLRAKLFDGQAERATSAVLASLHHLNNARSNGSRLK